MFWTVPLSIIRSFHCTHSSGICHTGLMTACEQDTPPAAEPNQFRPDPARKLSANLYNIHECCVHIGRLLVMYRGTARNM